MPSKKFTTLVIILFSYKQCAHAANLTLLVFASTHRTLEAVWRLSLGKGAPGSGRDVTGPPRVVIGWCQQRGAHDVTQYR